MSIQKLLNAFINKPAAVDDNCDEFEREAASIAKEDDCDIKSSCISDTPKFDVKKTESFHLKIDRNISLRLS